MRAFNLPGIFAQRELIMEYLFMPAMAVKFGGEQNRWVPSKWCRNWSLKNSLPNSVKVSTKSPLQAQVVPWRVRCKLNNGPLWGKTSWCTWRQLRVIPLQTDLDKASIYKFSNIQFKTYHQHTSLSLFLLSMEKLWCIYPAHSCTPLVLSCCWSTLSPLELRIMVAGLPCPSSATISSCNMPHGLTWRFVVQLRFRLQQDDEKMEICRILVNLPWLLL